MEVSAVIKEIKDKQLLLETEAGETFTVPASLVIKPELGQTLYISCSPEPGKAPRELLNEIFGDNEA